MKCKRIASSTATKICVTPWEVTGSPGLDRLANKALKEHRQGKTRKLP